MHARYLRIIAMSCITSMIIDDTAISVVALRLVLIPFA